MSVISLIVKQKFTIGFGLFLFAATLFSYGLSPGQDAPAFYVSSGNDKIQTLEKNWGKIIVLFYEFRTTIDKNLTLKKVLRKYYDEHIEEVNQSVLPLAVVDASSSFWPITLIWKRELRRHSKIAGMTIYADWSGKMYKNYHIKKDNSNFFIIDSEGIVRYYGYGEINKEEIRKIKSILKKLYSE